MRTLLVLLLSALALHALPKTCDRGVLTQVVLHHTPQCPRAAPVNDTRLL